jgi:hypothetical protein
MSRSARAGDRGVARYSCRSLLATLLSLACLADESFAQRAPADDVPDLDGLVLAADGRPIANADVGLLGLGAARTDSLGRFGFRGVPTGTFIVRVQRLGFAPLVQVVAYDGAHPQHLTLRVGEAATMLAPVVVRDSAASDEGRPGGFEQRRRSGQGLYLTEHDIAERHASRVEHLLGQLPGVQVDSSGAVHIDRGATSILGDNCQSGVQIFIDGVAVGSDFSLRNLSASALRGIEVYRGVATTPIELRSARMACGTIAMWTK